MANKFNRQRKRLLIEAQLGIDPEKQRLKTFEFEKKVQKHFLIPESERGFK